MTFRTGWDDDAAMVAFHCGPPGGQHLIQYCAAHPDTNVNFGHQHPDAGSYIFWSDRRWRIGLPGAYTHDKKTHDENTWLVNGKGQRGEEQWMNAASYIHAPAQAHLVTVASSKEADYVVGEAAPAYDSDAHLTSLQRHLLFVKSAKPYVVVYDQLAASEPVDWVSYLHVFEPVTFPSGNQLEFQSSTTVGTQPDPKGPTTDPTREIVAATDTTFGTTFGPAGFATEMHPLMVLAHEPMMKVMQHGYEIATTFPKSTTTWQVTVITADASPAKMNGTGLPPALSVGSDKIEWKTDGTVSLNGKALVENQAGN